MTRPLFVCEGLSLGPASQDEGPREVSFAIAPGEVLGFVSPGDGRLVLLLDTLSGLRPSGSGTARLAGEDLDLRDPAALAKAGIARTFAEAPLPAELDPHDLVTLAGRLARGPTTWRLLRRAWSGRDGDDQDAEALLAFVGLRGRVGAPLAPPERRRADLARALAQRPRLLLLDRPFAGADDVEAERWLGLIRALAGGGIAILVADHDVERVTLAATRVLDTGAWSVWGREW